MTQSSLYHDPFAGVPPEQVIAPPEVVAAIEEQCSMPFAEAVEKYGGKPVLCPDGTYVAFAHPPGCGREHFAAVAEVYRKLLERWGQQERARRVTETRTALRLDGLMTEAEAADKLGCSIKRPRKHKPKTPKRVPSPDTITATTPLRLDIAAQIAFPDGSVGVSGLRREIERGNLRAEMIAGKMFTTLANIDDMRKKCAVPTKAPESSSENHGGRENPTDGSSSTAMPADVASSARQAHLRQTAQRLRASGQTPKKPSPTISDESTSRNSAAVIRLKSE
jgi:hypothetical protein